MIYCYIVTIITNRKGFLQIYYVILYDTEDADLLYNFKVCLFLLSSVSLCSSPTRAFEKDEEDIP